MSGPPPKDPKLRRRRNKPAGFTVLPAEGRQGDAPPWPLAFSDEWGDQELALWEELWRTPQASEWERLGWTRIVARYCRLCVEAEAPAASRDLQPEVRQLEDRLGMTPKAMQALRWTIDDPTESEDPADPPNTQESSVKAVDP